MLFLKRIRAPLAKLWGRKLCVEFFQVRREPFLNPNGHEVWSADRIPRKKGRFQERPFACGTFGSYFLISQGKLYIRAPMVTRILNGDLVGSSASINTWP